MVHNNKHRYIEEITRGGLITWRELSGIYTRGNQSSGPLILCPTRAGEALLEAAKQAERAAEGGGVRGG